MLHTLDPPSGLGNFFPHLLETLLVASHQLWALLNVASAEESHPKSCHLPGAAITQ